MGNNCAKEPRLPKFDLTNARMPSQNETQDALDVPVPLHGSPRKSRHSLAVAWINDSANTQQLLLMLSESKQFVPDQIEAFRQAFKQFEDDSSQLTVAEIRVVLRSQGVTLSQEEVCELIDRLQESPDTVSDVFSPQRRTQAPSHPAVARRKTVNNSSEPIQLLRERYPLFLPFLEGQPEYEFAEAQRRETVKQIVQEQDTHQRHTDLKRSATRAALVQSHSLSKISRSRPKDALKHVDQSTIGGDLSTWPLGAPVNILELLKRAPAGSASDSIFCYEHFQVRSCSLFSPQVLTLLTDVVQTFCIQVAKGVDNVTVVDDTFQCIKTLYAVEAHSNKSYSVFYGSTTIPNRCRRVFLAHLRNVEEQASYEVFCHFDVRTYVEYTALTTAEAVAAKSLKESMVAHQFEKAVLDAKIVLHHNPTEWNTVMTMAMAYQRLDDFCKAIATANMILDASLEVLPANSPFRMKAFELITMSERHRDNLEEASRMCRAGLQSFPDSSVLRHEEAKTNAMLQNNPQAYWHAPDNRALSVPQNIPEIQNLSGMAKYLAQPFTSQREKARAIFRWICDNIEYDCVNLRYGTYALSDIEAEGAFSTRKAVCCGFAALFQAMCKVVGIECESIRGKARSTTLVELNSQVPNHVWNAFMADGSWCLADCTWAAGTVNPDFSFARQFNAVFWMPDPAFFIHSHFPENEGWQLLSQPVTQSEFLSLPPVTTHILASGIELVSHKKQGYLTAEVGSSLSITLRETKMDRIFLLIEVLDSATKRVVIWNTETVYTRETKQHVVMLKPSRVGSCDVNLFYAFSEVGPFNWLVKYCVQVSD